MLSDTGFATMIDYSEAVFGYRGFDDSLVEAVEHEHVSIERCDEMILSRKLRIYWLHLMMKTRQPCIRGY